MIDLNLGVDWIELNIVLATPRGRKEEAADT